MSSVLWRILLWAARNTDYGLLGDLATFVTWFAVVIAFAALALFMEAIFVLNHNPRPGPDLDDILRKHK